MKTCDEVIIFSKKTTMEKGQNEFCSAILNDFQMTYQLRTVTALLHT